MERETGRAARSSIGTLIGTYVVAAVLGWVLGAQGLLPFGGSAGDASTPLARVGLALREPDAQASPASWAALRGDLVSLRAATRPEEREVLELVLALRGLASGGETDWNQAEQLCRGLKWPRCDRAALEAMKRGSRP